MPTRASSSSSSSSSSWNPLAFLKTQVSVIGCLSYAALFAAVLVVHYTVPPAPSNPTPVSGVNLTQAWLDLQHISDGYHPWGSRRNDALKDYLVTRLKGILKDNDVGYAVAHGLESDSAKPKLVTLFVDDTSNSTSRDDWTLRPVTIYAESQNILVYVRGLDDAPGNWWNESAGYDGSSGVLVNAHYDSVPSGYGATDDGVGVVTVLQLVSHFSKKGNQPKRGIVALLNNGEETGLYGARNYVRHPLAQFPHTFLNLEGAGAGRRAMLFRSTDAEVTRAYAHSPYPFGSIVTGDGFKRGLVRSGTDYSIFQNELGLRGLDLAFFQPRARYHTNQDSARETSPDSLWHMLSAALATTQHLTSYQGDEFEGGSAENGRLDTGSGTDAVWFDVFGLAFAVLKLRDLFALSVTMLVAGPVLLIILELLLHRAGKWYPFAGKEALHASDGGDDSSVRLHGRRGFFRTPIAFIVATAGVLALAYLLTKLNPLIVYSSEYAVWAMMLSAFFAVAWFCLAGAASIRPTALHRMFVLVWLYAISWVLLVIGTVAENNFAIGSGYFVVIYHASILVALLISYLELFALPTKSKYAADTSGMQNDGSTTRATSRSSRRLLDDRGEAQDVNDAETNERTSLLRGRAGRNNNTFAGDVDGATEESDPAYRKAFQGEQPWSSSLPQWTWILQFLALVPINVIIVGQLALIVTSSLHQTLADGNPALPIYLLLAGITILLVLPFTPFLHRVTHHIPMALVFVLVGCLVYNLLAFPFSREARLKAFFVQQMDLNTGVNNISLTGVDGYVQQVVAQLPSAAGQSVDCSGDGPGARKGLTSCAWHGPRPNVVPLDYTHVYKNGSSKVTYRNWLDYNTTHTADSATISLRGLNTKQCRIAFDNAVSRVHIEGAGDNDPRQPPSDESQQVVLFSRQYAKTFKVGVAWDGQPAKGQKGRVICMWSDGNEPGVIPAWDEVQRYAPVWAVAASSGAGLFEGYKDFKI